MHANLIRPLKVGSAIAVLLALAVWGARWAGRQDEKVKTAVDGLRAAQSNERITREALTAAIAKARTDSARADSLAAQSRRDSINAAVSQRLADAANKRFEELAGKAPPECLPLAAEARETIRTQGLTIGSLTSSRDAEKKRADGLQVTVDDLMAKGTAQVGASARVDTAATVLIEAVRPKWYAKLWQLRPKVGVGAAAVYDPQDRRFHGGPSLALVWTF